MAIHRSLQHLQRAVLIAAAVAVLGFAAGALPSVPVAFAIHEGNEATIFDGPWGGGE
jgi:hypothetical protein